MTIQKKRDSQNDFHNGERYEEFFCLPRAESFVKELHDHPSHALGDRVLNERITDVERFTLPVEDNSMESAGIQPGDYVVIQSSKVYQNGDILAVRLGDEVLVRRYFLSAERIRLECDPPSRQTVIVEAKTPGFEILGRVVQIIREIE